MRRMLLPLFLATALLGGATTPAAAQVLSATKDDPAERPDDPGRDIESISTSFDSAAGTWRVAARFYGVPTAETSALLRVNLAERLDDGSCAQPSTGNAVVLAYTDPADKGGQGLVNHMSVNLVKTVDADQKGFSFHFTDSRLAGRAACGIAHVTLSRRQPFDGVGAFEFPGAPTKPAPGTPEAPAPGTSGPPGDPASDTTAPSAQLRIIRAPKDARRGVVRISILAATEKTSARATLYGPGNRVLARRGAEIVPGQDLRIALKLGERAHKRLKRTGRLPVRVVVALYDAAGNKAALSSSTTLRYKR